LCIYSKFYFTNIRIYAISLRNNSIKNDNCEVVLRCGASLVRWLLLRDLFKFIESFQFRFFL
jgi:hypothetical protein